MYLYKCDRCGHLQLEGEKFYHLSEITGGDRQLEDDLCSKCVELIINSKIKEK